MSLAALVVIVGLVCFYFFVYKAPGEEDFTPLTVTIELGDSLPIRTREYVEPGIKGSNVDELQYSKDTSKVKIEEVGTYEFTITYKGITKTGNVIIQDTTEPELTTRNVTIAEGSTYSASSFVESCIDYSGCNYAFQDSETTKKYTSPGVYQVYIIATDAFNNPTTKKANLIIENKGAVKTYIRTTAFDFNTGYSLVEEYDLSFAAYDGYSLLTSGIHKRTYVYEDEDKYTKKIVTLSKQNLFAYDISSWTRIRRTPLGRGPYIEIGWSNHPLREGMCSTLRWRRCVARAV